MVTTPDVTSNDKETTTASGQKPTTSDNDKITTKQKVTTKVAVGKANVKKAIKKKMSRK